MCTRASYICYKQLVACFRRCAVTRQTTRRGIITSWLPAVNYDPVRLLQCIGFPDAHSLAAATALLNLWQTAETWIGEDSSGDENTDWYIPHRAAMQRGLEQATNFSISDLLCSAKSDSSKDDCDIPSDVLSTPRLPLERLFVVRSVLTHPSTAPLKREALFARVVPDIPVLCQVLQDCAARLVQTLTTAAATNTRSFNAQDDQQQQVEDDLVFVCCELLQLATISHHHNDKVNDGKTPGTFMEEGSRRIFAVAMKKLLTNLVTPCDLIEPCCQALLSCCCNEREVETDILAILQHLVTENDAIDELRENVTLRILSILTVVFESALSPSQHHNHSPKLIRHDALMVFASHIVPAVSSSNALIREAAVSCLGRFGFVSFVGGRVNDVTEKYLPLLYTVAVLEEERMEIRLQAIMALMDWSLFFVGRLPRQQSTTLGGVSIDARMYDLIRDLMDPSIQSVGTVCIAAEIATKCLLSPQWEHFLHDWLARLVWLYFVPLHNSGGDNEDDDVERVGSPIRLQQVMSTFFPTLCTMSPSGRNALTESIATLLQIAATPKGIGDNRRGKKAKLPLVTKMLDFVVSMVENGLAAQMQTSSKQPFLDSALEKDAATSEASPCLLAAVQVATFLTENSSNLSTTTQRGLCKWIGNISLANIEKEQWEHLSLLKNLVEELVGNVVDDDAQCLESLYRVEELLADVEVEEEVVSDIDEDDDKELIEALKPMIIAGPGIDIENQAVVVALSATCKAAVLVGNEKYRPITAVSRSKGSNPFSELLE